MVHNSRQIRIQRYESRITNFLNEFINKEVYNLTLKFAKIMYVRLSNDYTSLKIYVDCLDRDKVDSLVKKLNANKNVFRTQLAQNFDFKKAPEIIFVKDKTVDRIEEIDNILNELKNKE